jgi:L-aminopeptidase/D-esterase-like protein
MVEIVNAMVLSGGSAFGIAAASGVTSCLESQRVDPRRLAQRAEHCEQFPGNRLSRGQPG